jgi:uncharacterized protein with FMN-binding domain
MRRSPIVIAATVAGTTGALAFHPHSAAVPAATASASKSASSSSSSSSASSTTATRTATGDAIPTQYGDAQVRVTLRNGKITDVTAIQLQGNDPRSQMISSSAEPILRQEALSAQSASIDSVSGATYTSESYKQSLQSALTKLGF